MITLPHCQLGAQAVEVEIGKRVLRAVEIPQGTIEDRARSHTIALGLMMEGDRQLDHPLSVQTEEPLRWPLARQGAPYVFEHLVGVEKMGVIEQIEAAFKALVTGRHDHIGFVPSARVTLHNNLRVSID